MLLLQKDSIFPRTLRTWATPFNHSTFCITNDSSLVASTTIIHHLYNSVHFVPKYWATTTPRTALVRTQWRPSTAFSPQITTVCSWFMGHHCPARFTLSVSLLLHQHKGRDQKTTRPSTLAALLAPSRQKSQCPVPRTIRAYDMRIFCHDFQRCL